MSWSLINSSYTFGASSLDGSVIYAYNTTNCYISTNYGASFISILTLNNITTISTSSNGSEAVIGGTSTSIYNSTNFGNTISFYTPVGGVGNWSCSCCDDTGVNMIISEDSTITDNRTYTLVSGVWGLASSGFKINSISWFNISGTKYYLFTSNVYNVLMTSPIFDIGTTTDLYNDKPFTNACCSSNGQYIYAVTYGTFNYVYRSDDYGESFETRLGSTDAWKYVKCSSNGEYVIVCNYGSKINYSVTYGDTFAETNVSDNWTIASVSDNGQNLYASKNTTGVYQSTDGGGVTCFSSGTNILTINNYVTIDNLNVGDIIITTEGEKKIIYIGYNTSTLNNFKILKKNKYKENIPNEDLILSKGHSVLFNDIEFNKFRKDNYNFEFYKYQTKITNLNLLLVDDCILFDDVNSNDKIKYFQFVLENNDVKKQYGIYANNMLCETMSEDFIPHSNLKTKLDKI